MADVEIEIKLEGEGGEAPLTRKEFQSDIATRMSEDVERAPVIPKEWAANVRKLLADNISLAELATPLRVATALTNTNPEAYTPRFLSLGPYHYSKLKKGTVSSAIISTSERYKVVYTTKSAMRQKGAKPEKSFECITVKIEGMLPEIEEFYDTKIEDRNNFSLMMAVDTSFLLCFLFSSFGWAIYPSPSSAGSEDDRVIHSSFINLSIIKCDVLMLENQIPLCVLKAVFEEVKHALLPQYPPPSFDHFLLETYRLFSPFLPLDMINADDLISIIDAFQREQHLLGCMHAAVLPFVRMQDKRRVDDVPQWSLSQKTKQFFAMFIEPLSAIFFIKKRHHDFLSAYNAGPLGKAGIKFKSFSTQREEIRFDKYTETLYLPPITLSNVHTEVFLKNMLALEFNDTSRRCNSVTRYVALMNCLIETPEDVHVLRHADVIRRQSLMLTDAYVAKMWDDMCQPFFAGHLDPPEELKWELKKVVLQNHYKEKMRKVLWRVCLKQLLRAGKFVTLLFGVMGLVLTAVQTYCGIEDCAALLHRKLKI